MPFVFTGVLCIFLIRNKSKILLAGFLPFFILLIIFLSSAILSDGAYYPTKRSLFLSILFLMYCFLSTAFRHDFRGNLLAPIMFSVFLIVSFKIFSNIFFDSGFNASTDNKNEIGTWAFLGVVLNCLYYIREKTLFAFILLFTMVVLSFSTLSAKYFFPNLILFIYSLSVGKYKLLSIFILLSSGFFIIIFSSIQYDLIFNSVYQMISKNLAIFDKSLAVGQNAVSTRTSLILDSLKVYINGNLFIGQGLESERYKIGTYSHNSYVSILVGGGLFGFASFFVLLLQLIVNVKMNHNKLNRRFFYIVLVCLIVVLNGQRFYDSIPIIFVFSILFTSKYIILNSSRNFIKN